MVASIGRQQCDDIRNTGSGSDPKNDTHPGGPYHGEYIGGHLHQTTTTTTTTPLLRRQQLVRMMILHNVLLFLPSVASWSSSSIKIQLPRSQPQRPWWKTTHHHNNGGVRVAVDVTATTSVTSTDPGGDESSRTFTTTSTGSSSRSSTDGVGTTTMTSRHVAPTLHLSPPTKDVGLYVHIPYCRKRCYYCNFAIVPIGDQHSPNENDTDVSDPVPLPATTTTTTDHIQTPSPSPPLPFQTRIDGFHAMNDQYVRALLNELRLIALQNRPVRPIGATMPHTATTTPKIVLQSIYFGGGTPSLLPLASLREIFHALRRVDSPFVMCDDCEITLEIDPGTFTRSMVQEWKSFGINRFSLGVQSMDDALLRHLGRTHTVTDVYDSIQLLESVYGSDGRAEQDRYHESPLHYSIDLISGIPGLTISKWMDTLEMVTTTLHPPPKHFSIYDLQIETNTVFGRRYDHHRDSDDDDDDGAAQYSNRLSSYQAGTTTSVSPVLSQMPLPSPQEAAFMYQYASGYLRSKSHEHYEISSYAYQPKQPQGRSSSLPLAPPVSYRSRHNQIYWGYHNVSAWYAVGLGATSFDLHEQIVKRPPAMSDYVQWVDDTYTQEVLALSSSTTKKEENRMNRSNCSDPGLTHSTDHQIVEEIMDIVLKRLRTIDGLSLQYIKDQYGSMYVNAIVTGIQDVWKNDPQRKLITITRYGVGVVGDDEYDQAFLRLVDPMGFLYSNTIISNIFYELLKQLP